jgi:predicted nucleotidyltransferase
VNLPLNMPPEKAKLLDTITMDLCRIRGIVAVVLGGSHARGFARRDSDIDIGIYYRETAPFSVDEVRSIAERVSTPGTSPIVTAPYEWGAWVNGGAWIHTSAGKIDFLYKNLEQIQSVIDEGQRGIWRHDYDQQPPYGFRSVVYFGETRMCVPLYDPEGEIARLKQSVAEYPSALKSRIVKECLWQAEFTFFVSRTFVQSSDIYSSVGSMTRVAQALVHALFALNNEYFVSDKYANRLIDQFALRPPEFTSRLARILSNPGTASAELAASFELLRSLWLEIVDLTAGSYEPRYRL